MSEWNEMELAAYRDPRAERSEFCRYNFSDDGDVIHTRDGLRVEITLGWDHWATQSSAGRWDIDLDNLYTDTDRPDGYPELGGPIYTPFLMLPRKIARKAFFYGAEPTHIVDYVSRKLDEHRRYAAQYHRFCDRGLMLLTADVYAGNRLVARRQLGGVDPASWRSILKRSALVELATGDARETLAR